MSQDEGRPPHDGPDDSPVERKQRVLSQGSSSVVRSITDAIVIKNGDPFFLCPPDGRIPVGGRHGHGLYFHDTRYLSGYELRLASRQLTPLAATAAEGTRARLQLSNVDLRTGGRIIAKEQLDVRWTRTLEAGPNPCLADEIELRNLGRTRARFPLSITLAADFLDVFAIRGLLDERPGDLAPARWTDGSLRFCYDGKDGVRRSLEVSFDPRPARTHDTEAEFDLDLDAGEVHAIRVRIGIGETPVGDAPPVDRSRGAGRGRNRPAGDMERSASVTSDSRLLDSVIRRSLDDLVLLRSRLDGHAFYEAGIPWFATLFGRDSLTAAMQTLAFDTDVAASTLRLLASRQGKGHDAWREEQPGRILHELRVGELARLGEIPHTPFFGTVDATPLFLIVLARHAQWTGSTGLFEALRENVDRALDWIDRTEDRFDGWLAYDSAVEDGLVNQGWKDSGTAIVDEDGRIAKPPIALAEVQGYVYRARRAVARLLDRIGEGDRADRLRSKAEDLRIRFEDAFWDEDLGCYVLARAGDGLSGACHVVASNAGQVLWTGIASRDRAARVADRLMADDVFSGWGVRTLSTEARAYSPIGYHVGTVWPHDNGLIAAGFRRYGLADPAQRILTAITETAMNFDHQRLPECFAGYGRSDYPVPVRYPVACHPQAWAAGAVPHLIEATLGLLPDGFTGRLRIVDPRLPAFVSRLAIDGLRVGSASTDLVFSRDSGGRTTVDVRRVDGELDVVVERSPSEARSRAGTN